MGVTASITGLDSVSNRLTRMLSIAAHKENLYKQAGEYMVNTEIPLIFRETGPGWDSVARGGKPLQDTGRLRDSITYRTESDNLIVGTNIKYAPLQQYGGTVTPKNATYLTIPASTLSVTERRTFDLKKYDHVFFRPSAKGGLIAFQNQGKGKIRMLAVLKEEVTIKKRTFLYWSERAISKITSIWARNLSGD